MDRELTAETHRTFEPSDTARSDTARRPDHRRADARAVDATGGSSRRAIDEAAARWRGGARVVGYPGRPSTNHPSVARGVRRRSRPAGTGPSDGSGRPPAGRIRRRELPDGMTSLEFIVSAADAEQLLRLLRAHPLPEGPIFRSNGGHGRWPGGGGRSA